MQKWQSILVSEETKLIDVMQIVDKSGLSIALVVNSHHHLLGIITDGDIRRSLLKQTNLDVPAKNIMRRNPKVAHSNASRDEILGLMQKESILHVPIVDQAGHIVGLEFLRDLIQPKLHENYVVLMVGGLGTRLGTLTSSCPKPLLKLGQKPVLQIIMENFAAGGFKKFFLCMNYKREMIKKYFDEINSKNNYELHYIEEEKQLGTAGALSLLPELNNPFFVMNGDLLTKINFQSLLDYHKEHKAHGTMCVKEYDFQVPYGVVRLDQHKIKRIDEKPIQKFYVNAGIYVLDPGLLSLISRNEYCDMPTLFDRAIQKQKHLVSFPISEYWLDIGRPEDLEKARTDYEEFF